MRTQTAGHIVKRDDALFLRRTLRGNALFSTISAIVVLLAANPLAEFMGIPYGEVFYIVGGALLPFALFVYYTSAQDIIHPMFVKVILVMDILWVVGSFLLIFFVELAPLTVAGKWIIGLLAEVVSIFAVLEFIGLRRLHQERG